MKECKKNPNTKNVLHGTFYDEYAEKTAPVIEIPTLGLYYYKGEKWTTDNYALYSLFYLGVSALTLPPFKKTTPGGVASVLLTPCQTSL